MSTVQPDGVHYKEQVVASILLNFLAETGLTRMPRDLFRQRLSARWPGSEEQQLRPSANQQLRARNKRTNSLGLRANRNTRAALQAMERLGTARRVDTFTVEIIDVERLLAVRGPNDFEFPDA